jgi:hypothetical protein
MRRAARVDENHGEIRDALRKAGVIVFDASHIGQGFPDLACSFKGFTMLVEVKMPKGKLTRDQERFKADWQGVIAIVRDLEGVETAVKFMRSMAERMK